MSGPLRLYNTLTRSKEVFEPIDPENVRLYVCGPTVYDYAHIGNARPVIVFDVLFRLLRHLYGEDHVVYARNITDVDDKINARAVRDYPGLPLNEAIAKVTAATEKQFHDDVAALGCLPPTSEPRATEHIEEMKALIERLVQRGLAYVAEDNILFSPSAMERLANAPRYGSLARRSLDEMLAGARVDVAPYKHDPMDFVLWKPSKPGEPGWPSPAGVTPLGRPGWHIECSAMSMAKLLAPFGGGLSCDDPAKNIFDIHGGGIDLVFPHHENEIAQSCCAFGSPRMANYWMHNGFLQVEGEKMSKSLGNFVTINELLRMEKFGGRSWPGDVLRFAMLQTHYTQPLDWTVKGLEQSEARLSNWKEFASQRINSRINKMLFEDVLGYLYDDLNTPGALASVDSVVNSKKVDDRDRYTVFKIIKFLGLRNLHSHTYRLANGLATVVGELSQLSRQDWNNLVVSVRQRPVATNGKPRPGTRVIAAIEVLNETLNRFLPEISLASEIGAVQAVKKTLLAKLETKTDSLQVHIETLIGERNKARSEKNFRESDRIRSELESLGVILKDSKEGTTWEVKR